VVVEKEEAELPAWERERRRARTNRPLRSATSVL
jgi:hypothetical protein